MEGRSWVHDRQTPLRRSVIQNGNSIRCTLAGTSWRCFVLCINNTFYVVLSAHKKKLDYTRILENNFKHDHSPLIIVEASE